MENLDKGMITGEVLYFHKENLDPKDCLKAR